MSQNLYKFLVTTFPRILTAVWMVCVLMFESIWISLLLAAFCFAYFFAVQVFVQRAKPWHSSGYLYAAIGCAVFTWIEYHYMILGRFLQ